jgi:hypothetical protein
MIVCCLYGPSSSTCSPKRPQISKHNTGGRGDALDRNPDANYRRCVDRDHDLYRATRLSSPSAGRSSNPGQLAPHSAVPGPPAFCCSPVGQPSTTCARRGPRFLSVTLSPLYGFLRSSPLSREQQLFYTLISGTVGTYPSQGDHRDRGADALPPRGVGALFIYRLALSGGLFTLR